MIGCCLAQPDHSPLHPALLYSTCPRVLIHGQTERTCQPLDYFCLFGCFALAFLGVEVASKGVSEHFGLRCLQAMVVARRLFQSQPLIVLSRLSLPPHLHKCGLACVVADSRMSAASLVSSNDCRVIQCPVL
ncbi:hypothetical protein BCV70DRAFT_30456 [Testicularia cyperi]|uniref:Uncharacterized protein n=1 Tax=Testicularia cyperi TaxID=1882483 RepID=A0A317XKQ9_9BASI|nr:hypothetical protein BCV70DRAFT_30456 [Testicularia cyperi]